MYTNIDRKISILAPLSKQSVLSSIIYVFAPVNHISSHLPIIIDTFYLELAMINFQEA